MYLKIKNLARGPRNFYIALANALKKCIFKRLTLQQLFMSRWAAPKHKESKNKSQKIINNVLSELW